LPRTVPLKCQPEAVNKELRVCRRRRARCGVTCAYLTCYISKRHSFVGVACHCAYARPRSDPGRGNW